MTEINGVLTDTMDYSPASAGLSKREAIAIAALQGILANHWCQNDYKNDIQAIGFETTAAQAVQYADALLLELSKPQP